MRVTLCVLIMAVAAAGQEPSRTVSLAESNLPAQPVGPSDLLSVSVYSAPEFTRTVRVGVDGFIRLPMLKQRIKAEGSYPADLETAIAQALEREGLLVSPYVTVTIAEYHRRRIVVGGAVRMPLNFQAEGPIKLLQAISRAQGLREDAGQEIIVTSTTPGPDGKPVPSVRRISVRGLIEHADPELNVTLTGGEEVRVPEAAKVYVIGNVKKNVVPLPSSLSNQMRPPCHSTIRRTRVRPMPVPSSSRCSRWNNWKIFS